MAQAGRVGAQELLQFGKHLAIVGIQAEMGLGDNPLLPGSVLADINGKGRGTGTQNAMGDKMRVGDNRKGHLVVPAKSRDLLVQVADSDTDHFDAAAGLRVHFNQLEQLVIRRCLRLATDAMHVQQLHQQQAGLDLTRREG